MKTFILFLFATVLVSPANAETGARHSEDTLIAMANDRVFCGSKQTAIAAEYINETENTTYVTCSLDAEGFVPLAFAGLGLGSTAFSAAAAGLGVAAIAAGGAGGATPDTQ